MEKQRTIKTIKSDKKNNSLITYFLVSYSITHSIIRTNIFLRLLLSLMLTFL